MKDDARLDIAANGFWRGRFEKAFFDVIGFSTPALNRTTSLPCKPLIKKTRTTEEKTLWLCVREIEHSTFTPLVLSTTGGMEKAATTFYKKLASFLSDKWDKIPELQSHYGLVEMSPEFCSIASLNYVHQRCLLLNKQTDFGQSHRFACSRFSDVLIK